MSSTLIPADDSVKDAAQGQYAATADSARLMAEFSTVHGGRYYYYGGYSYERLADTAAYARLIQARQSQLSDPLSLARVDRVESPSASDRLSVSRGIDVTGTDR